MAEVRAPQPFVHCTASVTLGSKPPFAVMGTEVRSVELSKLLVLLAECRLQNNLLGSAELHLRNFLAFVVFPRSTLIDVERKRRTHRQRSGVCAHNHLLRH